MFDFLDSNSFTTLALAGSPLYRNQIDWRQPVEYVLNNFAKVITANDQQFHGFSLVKQPVPDQFHDHPSPDGIAWEFTGQAVVLMDYVDSLYGESNFQAQVEFYRNEIRRERRGDDGRSERR